MNWGKGIGISIVVFITLTLSVVSYLMSLDFYLVSNDHYNEGVTYQETIDSKQRADELKNQVVVVFDEQLESLKVVFPNDIIQKTDTGDIHLYRPDDSELDEILPLTLNSEGIQTIPVTDLKKGKWVLKVRWLMDNESYLEEKAVII